MPNRTDVQPLSPLEVELADLLKRYEVDDKLIGDYLVRVRAVVAVHEVAKSLGRALNRDERKRAHVQYMDGRSVEQIVALLTK